MPRKTKIEDGKGAQVPSGAPLKKAAKRTRKAASEPPAPPPDALGHGDRQPNPPKEVDRKLLAGLAQVHCTQEEMAACLGMAVSTFRTKLDADPTLVDLISENQAIGKASLRRRQVKAAMDGDRVMLIWCGKQLLGQKEPGLGVKGSAAFTIPGVPGFTGGKPAEPGQGTDNEVRFTFSIGGGEELPDDAGEPRGDGIQAAAGQRPA